VWISEHTVETIRREEHPVAVRDPHWRDRAACRDLDPDLFFQFHNPSASTVAICRRCPVHADCLADVLEGPTNPEGVFAGTTKAERERLRAQAGVENRSWRQV
jgi:WhiB family redox-sensing transcriptional regulator